MIGKGLFEMKMPKGVVKVSKFPNTRSHKRGRVWDETKVILPDGTETKGWYDVMWGTNVYFFVPDVNGKYSDRNNRELKLQPYKADIFTFDTTHGRGYPSFDFSKEKI